MNFPDLPHLKQIQKDLWEWPRSRAALMVGAGLSLNAEPLLGVHTYFPTWRQLISAMFDELHPIQFDATTAQVKQREERSHSAHANPLRTASEYEAAFDRRKLDLLIRTRIPDADHQPGILHHLLLRLPWADVFTTNYDTLLERTEIDRRTYHPVTAASELTTAFAPRIVKLHGSFSSQMQLIVTEEDYRTYPRKFAPFVNSVQQSLLENSFVLIGFSGDDPNFLAWTGWIRDELGVNHAPIYLVGALDIGTAERSLLARRGVRAIDLAPVFEGIPTPNDVHAASIEWFLNSLLASRQPRPEKWPHLDRHRHVGAAGHPPIVDSAVDIPESVRLSPLGALNAETVTKLVKRWRFERENYPGWIVTPEPKRSTLWEATKTWLVPLINFAKSWPAPDRILLFREINWRLEMAMVPSFKDTAEPFQSALDEVVDSLVRGESISASPELSPVTHAPNSEVADAWLEIAFGLLRDARESYDDARWSELKSRIDKVVRHHGNHSDRNQYESALREMWNIDRVSAKAIISQWQPSSLNPLAMMWKAGLLAELEDRGEAQTILRSALLEIRRALRSQGQNIELLSLEGWCTYLIGSVESSQDLSKFNVVRDEFWERWQELKAWDCDPWSYMEYFDGALSAPPPELQKARQEVRGFDPGQVTVSLHFSSDQITPFLPGFACIRLYEQVGIPMRLQWLNVAGNALKNACRWVAPFVGFWSPALLIRAGKVDDFSKTDFLSRGKVAAMDRSLAKRLYIWCLQILERELAFFTGRIAMGSAQESLLEILPEILSRLAFKVEAAELRRTFPVVLQFHRQLGATFHPSLHDACEPWFLHLFEAADAELLLEWLPHLIKAPFLDESLHAMIPAGYAWPDPMQNFPCERALERGKSNANLSASISNATDWLLRRAASEVGEGRRRATSRLIKVFHAKLMTGDQHRHFGDLLWGQRTAANLPDLPSFAVFGFLHLPAPSGVDVRSVVKNYILSLPSTGAASRDGNGRLTISFVASEQRLIFEASLASKPIIQLGGEALGAVDWSSEEVRQLYKKARDWWANDKVVFERAKDEGLGMIDTSFMKNAAKRLGQFLARIVLPRMEWADESEWQQLLEWLQEMRTLGTYPTLALPYILLQRPIAAEAVAKTLTADINSSADSAVSAAVEAIRHWDRLSAIGRISAAPPNLMKTVVERVVFRSKPGIGSCLYHLAYVITERQEAITRLQAGLLTASLVPWHYATILPIPNGGAGEFHEEERPAMRVGIAMLAGALKLWFAKSSGGAPEPPEIQLWRDFCASDPLPEIRRAFQVWDQVASA